MLCIDLVRFFYYQFHSSHLVTQKRKCSTSVTSFDKSNVSNSITTITSIQKLTKSFSDLQTPLILSSCAGVCCFIGAIGVVSITPQTMPRRNLAYFQSALAAALLSSGCCDLLPEAAVTTNSLFTPFLFFLIGGLCASQLRKLTSRLSPTAHINTPGASDACIAGTVTALALALHNILEGGAILAASRNGLNTGIRLATAVSLENIPEGMCIAVPIYYGTKKRNIAIIMALIAGLMEPVGVLITASFGDHVLESTIYIGAMVATIAGILVVLALMEMLPLAIKSVGAGSMPLVSMWMGCGVFISTVLQPLLMSYAKVGCID